MKARCYNPLSDNYNNYGSRGITVCDEWKNNFQNFYDWAVKNGYRDDLSIDRIDNDKGYFPENCRWETPKGQQRNKRNNRLLTRNGETHCLAEWAEITGINRSTISDRIDKMGWTVEKPLQNRLTIDTQVLGPRGGLIFCKAQLAKKINSAVFPRNQGGPLMHVIAGKAVAAEEACTEEYKEYISKVVLNTYTMCEQFKKMGYEIVSGGTDNHLFMIDLTNTHPNVTGKMVQDALEEKGIAVNKNCVPGDKRSPTETSGIRIGCAAMTTKGFGPLDFVGCAIKINEVIRGLNKK